MVRWDAASEIASHRVGRGEARAKAGPPHPSCYRGASLHAPSSIAFAKSVPPSRSLRDRPPPYRGRWENADWARSRSALHDGGGFLFVGAEIGGNDLGIVANRLRRAFGNLHAAIHHHRMVGNFHHHTHVVLDQENRGAFAADRG